jgi:DNA-binding IclR family transcriptional regulator
MVRRLLEFQVQQILDLHSHDVIASDIAKLVGCSKSTVAGIIQSMEVWNMPYPPRESYRLGRTRSLTVAQVQVGDS